MIKIKQKQQEKNQSIFLKSTLGDLNVFNIDEKIKIPNNVNIILEKNKLKLHGPLGTLELNIMDSISFFFKNKNILLSFNNLHLKKKKKVF